MRPAFVANHSGTVSGDPLFESISARNPESGRSLGHPEL
jgi:hypothetical protein